MISNNYYITLRYFTVIYIKQKLVLNQIITLLHFHFFRSESNKVINMILESNFGGMLKC